MSGLAQPEGPATRGPWEFLSSVHQVLGSVLLRAEGGVRGERRDPMLPLMESSGQRAKECREGGKMAEVKWDE